MDIWYRTQSHWLEASLLFFSPVSTVQPREEEGGRGEDGREGKRIVHTVLLYSACLSVALPVSPALSPALLSPLDHLGPRFSPSAPSLPIPPGKPALHCSWTGGDGGKQSSLYLPRYIPLTCN